MYNNDMIACCGDPRAPEGEIIVIQDRQLDKTVPIPLYFQLKKLILEEIDSGNYPVGSMIPTENELSQIFQISRTTVRQTITELVREERLYRIKSKGTFVARTKINQEFINTLQSFNEEMRRAGRKPTTEVLSLKKVALPENIALQMGMPQGTEAVYLYRKRCADGEPVVRVETYLPYDRCGFLLEHDFTFESLYTNLSDHPGTEIVRIQRICEARGADKEDCRVLNMKRGQPIHHFASFGYNRSGDLLEFSLANYRGDQSRFRVEIELGKK